MFTNRKSTRMIAGLAVLAIAATGLISATTASAALPPANTPPAGPVTLTPASGTGTSNISINPGVAAACQGDSATGGYRWQTFIAANSVDTSQFIYGATGPTLAGSTAFISNLYSLGNPVIDGNTAIGTGVLTNFPSNGYQLNIFDGLITTTGLYKIGLACSLNGETTRFWQTTIQITATATSITGYSPFVAPAAPVLASPLTAGNGTLAGTFTQAAATPAVTGYTVTATPPSGPAITQTLAAGATSFTFTGLTNGTAYNVSLTSTNTAGTSAASNVVSGTPADPNQRPAITSPSAVPGSSTVTLSWVAPTGVAPTGYSVVLSSTVVGALGTGTFTAPAGAISITLTGLTDATAYSATVTPQHAAPFFAPATIIPFSTQSASSIVQDISVTRPIGGLVLTQQCGLYGTLGAEVADNFFPALALAAATGTGTIPTGETAAKYAQYPYPVDALNVPNPTYPTRCALDLGIADLIRSGPEAGKYFRTTGRLNQVTVVDTRNADTGWTLSGSASNFTSGANSFSGNYLGWTPFTSGTSGLTFDGYDQLTAAGPQVMPQGTASTTGLASSQVLGSANANSGLGIASFDARIKLLIPVTADNGVYTATLTLSALPKI